MFVRDTSHNRINVLAYAAQFVAVGALALAWLAIGLGLTSEPGTDPRLDLEAGGSFAVALFVYGPFLLVISPVVIVTGVLGLMPYRSAPGSIVVGAVVASLFAQLVGIQLYLSDYQPDLPGHLYTSMVAACIGVAVASAAACVHFYDNRSGRTRAASKRGAAVLAVGVLVGAVVTIPPVIAGSGTPAGLLALMIDDPNCGRNPSDWTDEGQVTVFTGDATQSYPPKSGPDNRFGVVVTLRNGTGRVESTPPTALSFRDELPFETGPPGTALRLHQPGTGDGYAATRLREPKCEIGSTRVVSATYQYADYGRPDTTEIEGTVIRSN